MALYTQGLTNTFGHLYDAAGTSLHIYNDNGGSGYNYNFLIDRQMEPGTYYLRVTSGYGGAQTGDYTLTLRTQESAPLVAGSTFSGNLSPGQIDFYRIQLEEQGLFELYTTGLTNTFGHLYDAAGTSLHIYNDNGGDGYNFHLQRGAFQPGVYLLKVSAGAGSAQSGPYEGFVLRPALAEPVGTASYPRSLSPLGDVDHFTFTLPARREVRIWTTGTTNTFGHLYNAAGASLHIYNDNGGSGSNFSIVRTLEPGKYFLRVSAGPSGSRSGPYQLHLDLSGSSRASATLQQKQALLRQKASLQKKFKKKIKKAKSSQAKRKLKRKLNRQIAALNRRIRAL